MISSIEVSLIYLVLVAMLIEDNYMRYTCRVQD